MKIQIKGKTLKTNGQLPSIRLGKAIMTLPVEVKCNQDNILGKEIVFPCNIHDMESKNGDFILNLMIDDAIRLDLSRMTALDFAIPQNTIPFTITSIKAYTVNEEEFDLMNIAISFMKFREDKIEWQIGEKDIAFPSFHKIKQTLIEKGPIMKKELTEVVKQSEAVSLDMIISAYQEERTKGKEYEKE